MKFSEFLEEMGYELTEYQKEIGSGVNLYNPKTNPKARTIEITIINITRAILFKKSHIIYSSFLSFNLYIR